MSFFVILLALLKLASALTDSEKSCVEENAGTLNNDLLVGTWYEVYKFSSILNLLPSSSCVDVNITKVTESDLERYKTAYGLVEPYKFDTTAVLYSRSGGYFNGLVTGSDQVKFLAWDPQSVFFGTQNYVAQVYKHVNEEYLLYNTCAVSFTKFLLSRRRDPTEEELQQVISTIADVQGLQTQKLCAPL